MQVVLSRDHDPRHAAQMTKVVSEIVNGRADALKDDISAGLDPNTLLKLSAEPAGYMSLLTLAAAACEESVVHQLVAWEAAVDGGGWSPPLVTAAAKGQASVVEFLIQHGASVEKVDADGPTALEDAVRQHQLSTVRVLLEHGSNPNKDVGGHATILDLVARSLDPTDRAIAKELRSYGAVSTLPPPQTGANRVWSSDVSGAVTDSGNYPP